MRLIYMATTLALGLLSTTGITVAKEKPEAPKPEKTNPERIKDIEKLPSAIKPRWLENDAKQKLKNEWEVIDKELAK
jgi:hypothetical protein